MPIIEVSLYPGRSIEQKAAFAEAITEAAIQILKTKREHVIITYDERPQQNWFMAGKPLWIIHSIPVRVVLSQINNKNWMDTNKHHRQLPITVGILIFDHVEVLDVADPFEVFSVARLNEERLYIEPSPFRVLLLGKNRSRSWQLAANALFPMWLLIIALILTFSQ